MPQLSKQETLLSGFSSGSNVGLTKTRDGEYSVLQNVRGNFKFGSKRRGILGIDVLDNGVLGIFDLKIDGDAASPDKIAVYDGAGDIILYDPSEFNVLFEFLFESGVYLNLQSPDLDWWEVYPDATTGILQCNGIVAPGTTISADLPVPSNALFGFQASSTKIYRLFVDVEELDTEFIPFIAIEEYSSYASTFTYSSVQAFTTGYGPVFEDSLSRNQRLSVANGGILNIVEI